MRLGQMSSDRGVKRVGSRSDARVVTSDPHGAVTAGAADKCGNPAMTTLSPGSYVNCAADCAAGERLSRSCSERHSRAAARAAQPDITARAGRDRGVGLRARVVRAHHR